MTRILPTTPLLLVLALAACEGPPARKAAPPAVKTAKPAGPVLPFIADDYPAALAQARARDLPLFVESWAPW